MLGISPERSKIDERSNSIRASEIELLNQKMIACPSCDSLWERPALQPNERAVCSRCHSTILTNKSGTAERTVAVMLACVFLYIVAISFPFMRMERSGLSNEISIIDAVAVLAGNSMPILAIICAALILIFPLTRAVLLFFICLRLLRRKPLSRSHAIAFRVAQKLEPWTMAEIFLIGVVVSLVKVGKLANIELGPAFWGLSALIVVTAYSASTLCRETVWIAIRSAK